MPIIGTAWRYFISFAPSNFLTGVLTLAFIYVPIVIILVVMLERVGSLGVAFRRDYGTLVPCAFMAWTASHLPFALAGLLLANISNSGAIAMLFWILSKIYFGFLMIFAVRTVFGASFNSAILTVGLSSVAPVIESYIVASRAVWFLASPGFSCFSILTFEAASVISGGVIRAVRISVISLRRQPSIRATQERIISSV